MSLQNATGAWGTVMPFPSARRLGLVPKPDRGAIFDSEAMPHLHDLFSTALRMTGDRTRAEDAVQETYLQAWKSFGRFEPGTNCKAWLFKVLFHCVHHHRRKWFRFPVLKDGEEFLQANLTAPEPVAEELRDEQIVAALEKIPSDYRAVVLLVDVEEFSYKEASGILGIPIGTVMSRLSRGRKLLREQLSTVAVSYGIVKDAGTEQGR
jgi:RNA polymerase sigma-70 factor (ECF subfamily)